jgi:hypothetical protein
LQGKAHKSRERVKKEEGMAVKVKTKIVFCTRTTIPWRRCQDKSKTLENDFLVTEIITRANKYFLNIFNLLKDKNTPQFTQ